MLGQPETLIIPIKTIRAVKNTAQLFEDWLFNRQKMSMVEDTRFLQHSVALISGAGLVTPIVCQTQTAQKPTACFYVGRQGHHFPVGISAIF